MTPESRNFRDVLKDRGWLYYHGFSQPMSPDELDIKLLIAALKAAEARESALREALLECLREHGGFMIKGECERRALAALALTPQDQKESR